MFSSTLGTHRFGFRPPAPPAGSVIVTDDFQTSTPNASAPHGVIVGSTITEMGFPGAVLGSQHDFQVSHTELSIANELTTWSHDKTTARALLGNLAEATASSKIDSYSRELFEGLQFGEHNSVRNFSSGISKSKIAEQMFTTTMESFESRDPATHQRGAIMLTNLAQAFDVSPEELVSEDLETRRAAKTTVIQGLINTVSGAIDQSPTVADSRRRFSEMVRSYESNNNSVVISAGNEGQIREDFAQIGVVTPVDFGTSLLAVDEVTSVGALKGGKIADYSNRDSQVDIFADGDAGIDPVTGEMIDGTSFSAPRVAAAMASLHALNPNASSEEIESMLKTQFSGKVSTDSGESVLALNKSRAPRATVSFAPPFQQTMSSPNAPGFSNFSPQNLGQVLLGVLQQIHQIFFPSSR